MVRGFLLSYVIIVLFVYQKIYTKIVFEFEIFAKPSSRLIHM